MRTAKTLDALRLPEGWRELPLVGEGTSYPCRRAVDPCGLVWLTNNCPKRDGDGWADSWRWELYVYSFGYARTEGRREWHEADVVRDGDSPLACPIKNGTITLPDGRKVTEGNWYH